MKKYVYLEDTSGNHYKFYEMSQTGKYSNFIARFGVIGSKGRKKEYASYHWDATYKKKIAKGYVDKTDERSRNIAMIDYTKILLKIEMLQTLILETSDYYRCEWERIAVEKIKGNIDKSRVNGEEWISNKHLIWLNKLWKSYKVRCDLPENVIDMESYRKWDSFFVNEEYDEMLATTRRAFYYRGESDTDVNSWFEKTKTKMSDIKKELDELMIHPFTDGEIMRIRIRKKRGDVVMVNEPFDVGSDPFDEEGYPYFAAIIDKVEYTDGQLDTGITWHKQGDSKIIGRSLISERDIQLEVPLNSSYSVSS